MKKYKVTKAMEGAREVAGVRNPGVGKALDLTDEQAAHPLRQGHIVLAKPVSEPVAVRAEPDTEKAGAQKDDDKTGKSKASQGRS